MLERSVNVQSMSRMFLLLLCPNLRRGARNVNKQTNQSARVSESGNATICGLSRANLTKVVQNSVSPREPLNSERRGYILHENSVARKSIKEIFTKMPPSQLKRLKNSLREKGVVSQQKSKRQKKRASKDGSGRDERAQRSAALQSIREQFNLFETRMLIREKHDVAISNGDKVAKNLVVGRPGVTRGLGEENVRLPHNHKRFYLADSLILSAEKLSWWKCSKGRKSAVFWIEDLGKTTQR